MDRLFELSGNTLISAKRFSVDLKPVRMKFIGHSMLYTAKFLKLMNFLLFH